MKVVQNPMKNYMKPLVYHQNGLNIPLIIITRLIALHNLLK